MAEHTQTPWEIRHRLNSVGAPNAGGRWVIAQTGTSKREDFFIAEMPFAACRGADEREHDANAAFIIKAVNNHDALVKALEEIVAAVAPNQGGTQGAIRKCAVAALRAASSVPDHQSDSSSAEEAVVRP